MEKLLSGKKALITGGSRGIGKAIAKCFAMHGASVALFGTNPDRGQEAAEDLKPFLDSSQVATFTRVDVSDKKGVEKAIAEVMEQFGQLDILVNNAGITRDNLLMKITEEDWEAVINTNLKSVFNTCGAVIRPMMKARGGKIINITSVVGLTGNAGQTNYSASKAGMIGFTKSLAKEVGKRGICINCIAPGFIHTDMTDALPEAVRNSFLGQIPMQRFGEADEIANAALFLASNLSNYITGQVVTVDGGLAM